MSGVEVRLQDVWQREVERVFYGWRREGMAYGWLTSAACFRGGTQSDWTMQKERN